MAHANIGKGQCIKGKGCTGSQLGCPACLAYQLAASNTPVVAAFMEEIICRPGQVRQRRAGQRISRGALAKLACCICTPCVQYHSCRSWGFSWLGRPQVACRWSI